MKEEALQTLLTQWTGATHFESVETSVLEALNQAYPFSPSSHLLLAKKYQLEASPITKNHLFLSFRFTCESMDSYQSS
jgi:hypothetical protein